MQEQDRRIMVDKRSIDYQLGAIITRIDGQNGQLAELTTSIGQLTKRIGELPCAKHDARIKSLENNKQSQQWTTRNKITFKQGIVIAILASLISTGTYLLLGIVI